MRVKIYLRAIIRGKENCLALFDSNGQGEINDLETVAEGGSTVIWKLDCCSRIRSITKIYWSVKEQSVFKNNPVKRFLCEGFKLRIEEGTKGKEKYTIECLLQDNKTRLVIDPFIRVPPITLRS